MAICKKARIIYISLLLVLFAGCFSLESDPPNATNKEISNKNNNWFKQRLNPARSFVFVGFISLANS